MQPSTAPLDRKFADEAILDDSLCQQQQMLQEDQRVNVGF